MEKMRFILSKHFDSQKGEFVRVFFPNKWFYKNVYLSKTSWKVIGKEMNWMDKK